MWKNQTKIPTWTIVSRTHVASFNLNTQGGLTYAIDISPYVLDTAKFVRITVATIDGDSDCSNVQPYESQIGGYAPDGSYQSHFVYNVAKGPSGGGGFYIGTGYDMDLPISGQKLYLTLPVTCTAFGGGMNIVVYLNAYLR